jgi:lysophospholipase L1-like esterase
MAGAGGAGGASGTTSTGSGNVGGAGGAGGAAELFDVHLVGRYRSDTTEASWSGSSARTTMVGPTASVRLSGNAGIWFEIVVDGESVGRFETTGGEELVPLATGLDASEHTIEIVRRNEGFFGTFAFVGFEPQSAIVPTPYPYAHRIEFVGDSLTCGYGIEGASATCNFSAETESAYSTYALVAARDLGAAAHLVCYSGKGVHQNYGGDLDEPMPVLYPRTLTNDASLSWSPEDFPADAVVVNLGTNDFSAPIDSAAFVADYVALLETIRARHPSAYLLGVTWAHWGASKEALVAQAFTERGDTNAGTLRFSIDPADGLGCDYHTNTVTNAKLGALLRDTLRERLGW